MGKWKKMYHSPFRYPLSGSLVLVFGCVQLYLTCIESDKKEPFRFPGEYTITDYLRNRPLWFCMNKEEEMF